MTTAKILLIDDEEGIRFGLREYLEAKGFEVAEAPDAAAATVAARNWRPDIALLDYRLPDADALELLPLLREIDPDLAVVILTGHGSIDLAVRAIKEGAEQFLTKPVDLATLLILLERILKEQRGRRRQRGDATTRARLAVDPFIGSSAAIRALAEEARRVLASDSPVFLHGETGSGKGVLARWLHENGPRRDEALIDLNCAGLSRELLESELFGYEKGAFTGATAAKPGLLEAAHKGSVFLDEIGDMDVQVQPRLLKVIEERKFRRLGDVRDRPLDVRLITATHHALGELIQAKTFRSDLYFRISTIQLRVPPLRERAEDVPLLAQRLLAQSAADQGCREAELSADAERALRDHDWPGNIRELRNVLERALLLSGGATLLRSHLRFDAIERPAAANSSKLRLEDVERLHIERVLAEEHGHVERASQRLGIPRSTLYLKLKRWGVKE